MSSIQYGFVSVRSVVDYIVSNPGKAIGFTSDTLESIGWDGEPSGWYGIKYEKMFDVPYVFIGYYGGGVDAMQGSDDLSKANIMDLLIGFFKDKFNMDINRSSYICVDLEDMR